MQTELTENEMDEINQYMKHPELFTMMSTYLFEANGNMTVDDWRREILRICRQTIIHSQDEEERIKRPKTHRLQMPMEPAIYGE